MGELGGKCGKMWENVKAGQRQSSQGKDTAYESPERDGTRVGILQIPRYLFLEVCGSPAHFIPHMPASSSGLSGSQLSPRLFSIFSQFFCPFFSIFYALAVRITA